MSKGVVKRVEEGLMWGNAPEGIVTKGLSFER
jgi:hypothetical protein